MAWSVLPLASAKNIGKKAHDRSWRHGGGYMAVAGCFRFSLGKDIAERAVGMLMRMRMWMLDDERGLS
jgi:hypothetical protein